MFQAVQASQFDRQGSLGNRGSESISHVNAVAYRLFYSGPLRKIFYFCSLGCRTLISDSYYCLIPSLIPSLFRSGLVT
jgi:hypothetical protein